MQQQPLIILAVVWIVIYTLPLIMIVVLLMRTRLEPVRLQVGVAGPETTPDEQDAISELIALGFTPLGEDSLRMGERCVGYRLFRHAQQPAFAELILQPQLGNAYPVTFHSMTAPGQVLVTANRVGYARLAVPDNVDFTDACATTLQGHWQAHLDRLAQRPGVDTANEAMRAFLAEWNEGFLPLVRSRGLCREQDGICTPTIKASIGAALAWQKIRGRLKKRYTSSVTEGAHQSLYYARCYEESERVRKARTSRRDVKFGVLALSVAISFLLWSWVFSPASAIALTVVLLVHEGGHAMAMRAFGHRDMNMFFLPFFGAVVTGQALSLAAWKQAVILFAGPLPGLIAGAAMTYYWSQHAVPPGFDWRLLASMALYVNLFNLLPIIPLDGGRLVELSLFGRWPRMRIVFSALSSLAMIGIFTWSKSPVWIGLSMGMAMALRTQWRAASLQRSWQGDLNPAQQLRHLFETIRQRWPGQLIARQFSMVRSVLQQQSARAARLWETALILLVMSLVWSSVGVAAYGGDFSLPGRHRHANAPVASQKVVSRRHSGDEVLKRQFGQAVKGAIDRGEFDSLETLATRLREQDPPSPSGTPPIYLFYYLGVKAAVDGIPIDDKVGWDRAFSFADRWMQARPDSATAVLVKSELLLTYGWLARGSGFSDTVSTEGARIFNDSMQKAYDLLQQTKPVSSRDPDWYRQMAAIYKNASMDRTAFMAVIDEAQSRYPYYWPTYTNGAQFVLPKWGGSEEETRAYVRHIDEHAPAENADVIYARVYSVIGCCGFTGPELFTVGGAKWQRMKKGLDAIRTQYPDPVNVDAEAANACRAGDADTLSRLLVEIGDDPVMSAWTDSISYFHECRDWALGNRQANR